MLCQFAIKLLALRLSQLVLKGQLVLDGFGSSVRKGVVASCTLSSLI